MDFIQNVGKNHYELYSEITKNETSDCDYDAEILKNYPNVKNYVLKAPIKREDPIFLNKNVQINYFKEINEQLKPIQQNFLEEKQNLQKKIDESLILFKKVNPIVENLPSLFWICEKNSYKDRIRKYLILNKEFWVNKIKQSTIELADVENKLKIVGEMIEITEKVIEKPANLMFRVDYIESKMIATIEHKKKYKRLKRALKSSLSGIDLYLELRKNVSSDDFTDENFLEQYFDKKTNFLINNQFILTGMEDVILQTIEKMKINAKQLAKKRNFDEIEKVSAKILEFNKLNPKVSSFYSILIDKTLYKFFKTVEEESEFDSQHVEVIKNIEEWAETNATMKKLMKTKKNAVENATKYIDEITFRFFPYEEAFFADKAIHCIEEVCDDILMVNKIELICIAISRSYLPDPMRVMQDIIDVITCDNFPEVMKDSCNLFISACQMILSRWSQLI